MLEMNLQTISLTTIHCTQVQDFQTTRYTCLRRLLCKTVTITCINKDCRVLAILSGSFLLLDSFLESSITYTQRERVSNKREKTQHSQVKFKGNNLVTDLFKLDLLNKLFILFLKSQFLFMFLNKRLKFNTIRRKTFRQLDIHNLFFVVSLLFHLIY